jgi:hypothetical protein
MVVSKIGVYDPEVYVDEVLVVPVVTVIGIGMTGGGPGTPAASNSFSVIIAEGVKGRLYGGLVAAAVARIRQVGSAEAK